MTAADPSYSRRWLILAVVGVAQVMVVLDATVINIALPSAQRALHFSNGDRQWVVTAYALAFGSLLPLGGRIGDLFGRKPTFLTDLIGFAAISAVGGLAQSFGWLVAARAAQGAPNERRADPRAALDTALGRGPSAVPLRPFIRTV
jgi:MFS family permease